MRHHGGLSLEAHLRFPSPSVLSHRRPSSEPGRRRRALARAGATAAVLAAALTGCGVFGQHSNDAAAAPTSTSTTSTSTTTSTTIAPPPETDPPQVLDPGQEPLRAVRLVLRKGQVSTISFTSDSRVDQDTGSRTQRLDSPPITQVLTYTVGAVTSEGAAVTVELTAIRVATEGTQVAAAAARALQKQLHALIGLTGTATITTLGELQHLTFDPPSTAGKALRARIAALEQQVGTLGPTLPVEPVGIGARWTATGTLTAGGVRTTSTATYTVTALSARSIAYTATLAATAEPQDLALQGLPKGTTARLESSTLTGSATGSLSLTSIGVTLRTRLSGPQHIVVVGPGGRTELVQQIQLAAASRSAAK